MKLAFSTLGCPEWSFEQIMDTAQRLGYDGIEFRGLGAEIDLVNVPEFAPGYIATTRRQLEQAGIAPTCLSSSVTVVASVATEVDRVQAVAHAERYIDLAHAVGAPFVRLFCGNWPPSLARAEALERAVGVLQRIGDYAQPRGVTAVVETHDAFVASDALSELIRLTDHPAVQVLWDIHHPYRMAGESVAQTMRALDGHVRYTHIKDSVLQADGEHYTYVLLGHGDVPIQEAIRALQADGYAGYLTLEWEKRWHPELDPPEITFAQYAEQMRAWLATR